MQDQFQYYHEDIDRHPFTGKRTVDFYAKISEKRWLNGYFNGHPKWDQVTNVTRGKTYHITMVEGYGDMCDYFFEGDDGKPMDLGDMFFVRPEEDETNDASIDKSAMEPWTVPEPCYA